MNHAEYAAAVQALYEAPLASTETPAGQKFPIGERVRIRQRRMGFPAGTVATVEYTYFQKYRPGRSDEKAERDKRQYSLVFEGRGSCAWFDEEMLQPESETPALLPDPPPDEWSIEFGRTLREAMDREIRKWFNETMAENAEKTP